MAKGMAWEYGPPNDRRRIQIRPVKKQSVLNKDGSVMIDFARPIRSSGLMRDGKIRPSSLNFRHNGQSVTSINLRMETLKELYECIGEYSRENEPGTS